MLGGNELPKLTGAPSPCFAAPASPQVVDQDSVAAGDTVTIQVELEREYDEEGELPPVCAPHFPARKDESWWLVVGNPKKGTLAAIKRVTLQRKAKLKLDMTAPAEVRPLDFPLSS